MKSLRHAFRDKIKGLRTRKQPLEDLPYYRYDSIKDIEGGMRLLRLLPGKFSEDIRCELLTTRRSEEPSYEALSYVWGDHKITEPIYCGGNFRLDITTNLADALRHLRSEEKSRVLFADAICIDQSNLGERGHQVAQMAEIFGAAECVIVWLGLDDEGSAALAIEKMRNYVTYVDQKWQAYATLEGTMDLCDFDCSALSQTIAAISDVFSRPWFDRVWVLQEAAVARQAVANIGFEDIPLIDIAKFSHYCFHCSSRVTSQQLDVWRILGPLYDVLSTYGVQESWMQSIISRFLRSDGANNGIGDLLGTVLRRAVKDERDYVYAMLGHPTLRADNGSQALVEPCYFLSVEELCRKLTIACITVKHDWSILDLVDHETSEFKMPSWMPDLQAVQGYRQSPLGLCSQHCAKITGNQLVGKGNAISTLRCPVESFSRWPEIKSPAAWTKAIDVVNDLISLDLRLISTELVGIEAVYALLYRHWKYRPDTLKSHQARVKARARDLASVLSTLDLWLEDCQHNDTRVRDGNSALDPATKSLHDNLMTCVHGQRVFQLQCGVWGIGPGISQDGDICCTFNGAHSFFVLRPLSDGSDAYNFIGQCYVPDLLYGEGENA